MRTTLRPYPSMARAAEVLADAGYRLLEPLGEGAMSRVFRAARPDGRRVVLKIADLDAPSSRSCLRAEALALGRIDHDNVVRVLGHHDAPEVSFLAMESLSGPDLGERIAKRKVSRVEAVLWLYEIADALDHVHACGLVHRDVKPANIVLDASRKSPQLDGSARAVLVDFGLARAVVADEIGDGRSPVVVGTPAYMAPEQALGLEASIGPASDRYALAAVALELFTGERPYAAMTLGRLFTAILELPPRRPSIFGFGGPELDRVFSKAMARDPERRFDSAREQVNAMVGALPRSRSIVPRATPASFARTVRATAA